MPKHSSLSPRVGVLLLLVAFTGVFVTQACDNPVRPKTKIPDKIPSASDPVKPAVKGKDVVPKDGSIQPMDVGPKSAALLMTTGFKGYTEPCGCTLDVMLGGLDRVLGYVEKARPLYTASLMVDGGDMLFEEFNMDKNFIKLNKGKARLIMQAHKRMGTAYTVPGAHDLALGSAFYKEMLAVGGMTPLGANVSLDGKALTPHDFITLGDQRIGLIGAVDPVVFKDVPDVKATPVADAVRASVKALGSKKPQTYVVLFHGEAAGARQLLKDVPELDFVLVGLKPRQTDQSDKIANGYTLEPYDQGRYLGILKLYPKPGSANYVNAKMGSKTELKTVEDQIEYVEQTIKSLPPAAPGKESPLLKKMRERLASLVKEQRRIKVAKIEVPKDKSSFIWRSVAMEPGLPINQKMADERSAFNKASKADIPDIPIAKVKPGQAFYVGTPQCATCHIDAANFWKTTNHAHAFETLTKRDKEYDPTCVGCHQVGYEKPGGSVVGKWTAPGTLAGSPITKDLRNVGCENCHGPGSNHIESIMKGQGKADIDRASTETTCMSSCHVPEHSPKFNYSVYREQILGPGHGKPMPE